MCVLTKYIKNVNAYLAQMKVKQMYLSRKTGIEKNKLSRILNGLQEISATDMEKIAGALGQKTEYFYPKNSSYQKKYRVQNRRWFFMPENRAKSRSNLQSS